MSSSSMSSDFGNLILLPRPWTSFSLNCKSIPIQDSGFLLLFFSHKLFSRGVLSPVSYVVYTVYSEILNSAETQKYGPYVPLVSELSLN